MAWFRLEDVQRAVYSLGVMTSMNGYLPDYVIDNYLDVIDDSDSSLEKVFYQLLAQECPIAYECFLSYKKQTA
ncbi:hypothetical protein GJ688_10005 [Heliobacillus mobilis]|uniref:Uncharacterized protein n=1 Tax=Heliobacterium mobile TaxID=28064 RepID=A0A6I3SK65_HELMO|nr:hypothetical protein [Heliobacterium mobile]MTV49311.1 hypothetical protein [Heliobacterium mobile]